MSKDIQIPDGLLHCPRCNNNYLHQIMATVYSRGEDEGVTRVTEVSQYDGEVHQRAGISGVCGNPSARRQGLSILFGCEFCGADVDKDGPDRNTAFATLHIYQHKGQTVVEWEYE